jgi:hypothetical protein
VDEHLLLLILDQAEEVEEKMLVEPLEQRV